MVRGRPEELGRVKVLMDDPAFFDPKVGRPSTPMETYPQMIFESSATGWASRACVLR